MRVVRRIDETGLYLEDVLKDENEEVDETEGLVTEPIPEGLQLWHPRWNGTDWVEGMSQQEIDARNNHPPELSPEQIRIKTLEQQLMQTNEDMMAFMEVMMGGGE